MRATRANHSRIARRGLAVPVLALALLAALSPVAQSATVRVGKHLGFARDLDPRDTVDPLSYQRLDLVVGRRERLDVRVTVSGGDLVLRARRGRLDPRGRCRSAGRRRVRCPWRGVQAMNFSLGPGNDRLVLATGRTPLRRVRVSGGAGDDVITGPTGSLSLRFALGPGETIVGPSLTASGGPGTDRITGSGGPDVIDPGAGRDTVRAVAGNDRIADPGGRSTIAGDDYDGGPGADTVDYSAAASATQVDLGAGTAARLGERDRLRRIENVTTGTGTDRLVGDGRSNALTSLGGRDTMLAGAGNDTLLAADSLVVDAGAGNDRLDVTATASVNDAQVICGEGDDRVINSTTNIVLPTDCERIELPGSYTGARGPEPEVDEAVPTPPALIEGTVSVYPTRVAGGVATFALQCSRSKAADRCRGTMSVDGAPAVRFDTSARQLVEVDVPLSPADVAALPAGVRARAKILVDNAPTPQGSPTPDTVDWGFVLRG